MRLRPWNKPSLIRVTVTHTVSSSNSSEELAAMHTELQVARPAQVGPT
eukprot:COSAG06_NODE_5831_length_3253_cov_28.968611_3_plen_47_part_01